MSSYKVPQDVEADDKLIGPFSFRQFIYLIVVAIGGAMAWGLWQLLPPLALIPLPIIIFFGALALPLRKDQPMEIYLAAVISFYLKPRLRLWEPDGIESLVEVTAPKTVERQRFKDLSQDEAERRLSYLADIVDTQGWAVRGVAGVPDEATSSVNPDILNESEQVQDILDTSATVSQNLDYMINESANRHKQELLQRIQQGPTVAPVVTQEVAAIPDLYQVLQANPEPTQAINPVSQEQPATAAMPAPDETANITFNPYPQMHQSVIQPASAPAPTEPKNDPVNTSETTVSPDIMNLVENSKGVSVETLAKEANRIKEKEAELDKDEVIISFR